MFKTPIELPGKAGSTTGIERPSIVSMLSPIERFKYPALSEAEEAMSLPLQVLCLAVFDAILVDMLERIAPNSTSNGKCFMLLVYLLLSPLFFCLITDVGDDLRYVVHIGKYSNIHAFNFIKQNRYRIDTAQIMADGQD